nr:FtsK/SpoIIIE domain-containing protein [Enterococcus faecalis]
MNKEFLFMVVSQWIFPILVMVILFIPFTKYLNNIYEKVDIERIWKGFLFIGIVFGGLFLVWYNVEKSTWFREIAGYTKQGTSWVASTEQAQNAINWGNNMWRKVLQFTIKWLPIYFRAFVLVWVISSAIYIQSLIWRISFVRGANIIINTVVLFPFLVFKYLFGYQTPIFDFVYSKLFIAKLKENLNDSYFKAIEGKDEKGQKFESGAGGTAQIQRVKATAIAIKRTKSKIRTAGGIRRAELITKNSRETDTDRLIKQSLSGFGKRIIASSIRFQDDPILSVERGGYFFDSDVSFNSGDVLGTWKSIFSNPFSQEVQVKNGGEGFFHATRNIYKEMGKYIIHFTPIAIYERIVEREFRLYTPDRTAEKMKYKAQQNLDLSVVPEPIDPDTGNDREKQIEIARKVAKERISDVTNALNTYKINGVFDRVLVGGTSAIYQYTLPRTADLPSDLNRVQEGISQLLKTDEVPIITIGAGILSISIVNGVNIPVDFKNMITSRRKGMKSIISGIAGVDAQGNNIYVELGDNIPHLMLFGATGWGKTVTIMNIVFSAMSAVTPDMLKIAYIDGKGNSFEFMRSDNVDSPHYHPNPFTYAQPADASGDIDYARALLKHFERETRRRIDLFKHRGVSKIAEFNKKYPKEYLYEILVVCDEFSAITDLDNLLKASELAEKGTIDTFEYLAKMSRSVGIHLLLANQTARKEKVPGKISANIGGRISLKVNEPIESDIALPDSNIAVHLINQAGEFYSTLNGIRNAEHGNSPYLSDDTMNALNDGLEAKFGHHEYVVTRKEVMREVYGEDLESSLYEVPDPMPNVDTPIDELLYVVAKYPEWAVANKDNSVFKRNKAINSDSPSERKKNNTLLNEALDLAEKGQERSVL